MWASMLTWHMTLSCHIPGEHELCLAKNALQHWHVYTLETMKIIKAIFTDFLGHGGQHALSRSWTSFVPCTGLSCTNTCVGQYLDALPNDDSQVFAVNLWDLSFQEASSTKPAPFLTTALLLLDEILTGGFTTKSDFVNIIRHFSVLMILK